MGSNSISAQFVTLLIEEYKGLPSLWEVDSEAYKNKKVKRKDYETLWHRLLAVDPLLTLNDLKKKIANIRSCYRREVKKIADSIRSGAKGDDVYAPTLWYFNQLDFLRDQEPRVYSGSSRSMLDDHDGEERKPHQSQIVNTKSRTSFHPYKMEFVNIKPYVNESPVKQTTTNLEIEIQQNQHVKNVEAANPPTPNRIEKDEANTFSESWALLFRKLSREQQLYGKRCIDEILYQGQLGNLNAYTYRNIELSRMCSSDSESSTTNKGNCLNASNCQNYDKEITSFFSAIV